MRLVIKKNSSSPPMTSQRVSTPTPRAYGSRLVSISATPPPCAVELTFQIVRPSKSSRASSLAVFSAAICSSVSTDLNRCGSTAPISTSLMSGIGTAPPGHVGDGVAAAVGDSDGCGVAVGVGVAVGSAVGVGLELGDAPGLADGAVDGVGLGVGPTPKLGATLPMRGRSCCEPEKGARSLGDDTTSAATAAAATSAVRPTGTASAPRFQAGRSPVFLGE